MLEKIKNFFQKLNNSYIIAAICVILICVILLGSIIGLVARPFITDMTYSVKYRPMAFSSNNQRIAKLVLLEGGRYSMTISYTMTNGVSTSFGDYGYGKVLVSLDSNRLQNVLILNGGAYDEAVSVQKNPFKITTNYFGEEVTFTCVGGIFLLVCYCVVFAICAAIATLLIIKRKDGGIVFTNKMRLIKRLKEIEEMLGVKHDA